MCTFTFQESLHIMGRLDQPQMAVVINGHVIDTDCHQQSIAVVIASYLAFNLIHPKAQEPVLEAMEGLLGFRRKFQSQAVKLFVKNSL